MKAVVLEEYGGPEALLLQEVAQPSLARDELLIKVHNTAINALEWKLRKGMGETFGLELRLPFVLGSEFAGNVEAVGSDVLNFKVGDAVFGFVDVTRSGGYAEYVTAKPSEMALKPQNIDFVHAAAIPVGALTSWQALFDTANLQSGQTILVHGATGGVGSMAVQLAKAKGARVIGTASGRNEEFVRSLGADQFIDYSTTRFEDVAQDVDVVFDTIGGETQERSFQTLRKGGILVSIVTPPAEDLAARFGVRAAVVYAQPQGITLTEIVKLVEAGKLKAKVETVLPLSQVRQAHQLMKTGHKRGKIVLQVS
ncbi:MAG TPA: NADP-dependent oxidoreductase [Abditibacteriaceae bacterium]|jgi:NADPH:quinone reductase-like Zn-dependent oxidoreductase